MQKIKNLLKAALVISVFLALILPGSAIITNMKTKNDTKIQYNYNTAIETAIHKTNSIPNSLIRGEDILVSWDNSDDDYNPKITKNNEEVIVVTYVAKTGAQTSTIPISYSNNDGADWTIQYNIDSSQFDYGSGLLESPDITFSTVANYFFWAAIDPLATQYNTAASWILSDIESGSDILIWQYSWTESSDYTELATTYVGEWQLVQDICTNNNIIQDPCLAYWWFDGYQNFYHPQDIDPNWASGGYYDGGSVLDTAPASNPEMATGANRIFMVMETYDEVAGYSKISYKATVTDLNPESETFLFTLKGGQGGMDKYADIEIWPWQMYIAENAIDPDVAAEGNTVAVVYTQDGSVKCKASNDNGENWVESNVAVGGYSCVYVASNHIYVAYVNNGNLYLVDSNNLGTTWSTPIKINDVDGTVVEEHGTASLGISGIVWTDNRDEQSDVYFEYLELQVNNPPSAPTISGPNTGTAGTSYDYKFNSVDPDNHQVKYIIDWGDGKKDTTVLNPSGTDVTVAHTWSDKGDYIIKVHAQDENGLDGSESTKTVTMPRNKALNLNILLTKILEHFPILEIIYNLQ